MLNFVYNFVCRAASFRTLHIFPFGMHRIDNSVIRLDGLFGGIS